MKIHLVTCKAYYTDGTGLIEKAFLVKKKAIRFIRSRSTGIKYNKEYDHYEHDSSRVLYKIETVEFER